MEKKVISQKRNSNCKSKGFTLIELLIVVAVVGVLSAVVIGALNITSQIGKANLAKAKTFAASLENSLAITQAGKWSFEEVSSPSKDTSGYGNDGTWGAGVTSKTASQCGLGFGSCMSFDGTPNSYISHSTTGMIPSSGTVAGWVKPPSAGARWGFWQTRNDALINQGNWIAMFAYPLDVPAGQTFIFRIEPPTGPPAKDLYFTLSKYVKLNNWTHLAFVWGGTSMKIYANGDLIASRNDMVAVDFPNPIDSQARIGYNGHDDGVSVDRLLDEVAVYSQALTTQNIQQLYAKGLLKHLLAKN